HRCIDDTCTSYIRLGRACTHDVNHSNYLFFQAEDGIRTAHDSLGLGDVEKSLVLNRILVIL
ncbi:hypothetical protein, partial [Clostridioides difficile]|uniref:hypothetical protein n=1 Tax=Clostridioides difficile TaxID=1496 RepID=UPI001A9A591B